MTKMTMREQLAYLIAEKPGISSTELAEFFVDFPSYKASVAGMLSTMYAQGGYRREKDANWKRPDKARGARAPYCYWRDAEARPEPFRNASHQTANGRDHEKGELLAQIAELKLWQAQAIERYPALKVPPLVLKAREIVAAQLRECDDIGGARHVEAGERDSTAIIKAVVRTLEMMA